MSGEIMSVIAYTAFAFSGAFGIITVVLWFYLDIRSVVADLRGKRVELAAIPVKQAIGTEATEEELTSALANEVTALLNGYRLTINEMIVHTEDRI